MAPCHVPVAMGTSVRGHQGCCDRTGRKSGLGPAAKTSRTSPSLPGLSSVDTCVAITWENHLRSGNTHIQISFPVILRQWLPAAGPSCLSRALVGEAFLAGSHVAVHLLGLPPVRSLPSFSLLLASWFWASLQALERVEGGRVLEPQVHGGWVLWVTESKNQKSI